MAEHKQPSALFLL